MKKLSKKQAAAIASQINTVVVWSGICQRAMGEKDNITMKLALRNESEATVNLADQFGIELPCLENARAIMASQ